MQCLFTLDSRREPCGRGKLDVVKPKRLLLLDTESRLELAADDGRSPPEPCGV